MSQFCVVCRIVQQMQPNLNPWYVNLRVHCLLKYIIIIINVVFLIYIFFKLVQIFFYLAIC